MNQNHERAAQNMYAGDADLFCRIWERVGMQDRPDCPIETVRRQEEVSCGPMEEEVQMCPSQEELSGDDFPVPEDMPCLGRASRAQSGSLTKED